VNLLYDLAYWHALAKLRLHTKSTLHFLLLALRELVSSMRKFAQHVCKAFIAQELPRESEARIRRETKSGSSASGGRKVRKFNVLETIKYHSLGDYKPSIKAFGTSDGFSTQILRAPYFLFFKLLISLQGPAQVNVVGQSEPLLVDFLHTRRLALDTNHAAHLMPAYHWGHDEEDVPPLDSLAYRGDEELRGWDWFRLYVNMYVHYLQSMSVHSLPLLYTVLWIATCFLASSQLV
jgi:hypothetical protein